MHDGDKEKFKKLRRKSRTGWYATKIETSARFWTIIYMYSRIKNRIR